MKIYQLVWYREKDSNSLGFISSSIVSTKVEHVEFFKDRSKAEAKMEKLNEASNLLREYVFTAIYEIEVHE